MRIAVGPRSGPRLTPPPSFETQTLGFSISFTSPFQLLCCSRGVFLVLSPNPICGHMVSLLLFRWRAIIVSFHDTHLPHPKDRSPRFCFLNSIDTLFPSPILSCYWNHISCITLSCLSLYAPNLSPSHILFPLPAFHALYDLHHRFPSAPSYHLPPHPIRRTLHELSHRRFCISSHSSACLPHSPLHDRPVRYRLPISRPIDIRSLTFPSGLSIPVILSRMIHAMSRMSYRSGNLTCGMPISRKRNDSEFLYLEAENPGCMVSYYRCNPGPSPKHLYMR